MNNRDFEKRYIAARKRLIEAEFAKLNPMQREAVLATEGPLLGVLLFEVQDLLDGNNIYVIL